MTILFEFYNITVICGGLEHNFIFIHKRHTQYIIKKILVKT